MMYLYKVDIKHDNKLLTLHIGSERGTLVRAILRQALNNYQIPLDIVVDINSVYTYQTTAKEALDIVNVKGNGYFDSRHSKKEFHQQPYIKYKFRAEKIDELFKQWEL